MRLLSHDDAIELLRRRGVPATRRNWSLGDTVVVPLGTSEEHAGIVVHSTVAWLAPDALDAWYLIQSVYQHERRRSFPSLDLAVAEALELVELFRLSQSCARCGGHEAVSFGERCTPGQLTHWISCACADCGARTEADGRGVLPDALRAIELRRHGTWLLRTSSEQTTQGWSALRGELALGLTELVALKRALPGEIFRGTFVEAKQLQSRLANAGVLTEIGEVAP